MHHALINAGAKVGDNCIINSKALIEHDAIVEDHCHISTSAIVNGGVLVRIGTFLGSNATVKQYTEIEGFYQGWKRDKMRTYIIAEAGVNQQWLLRAR